MSEADTYVQDLARLREIETALRKELKQHQAHEARALEDALRQMMLANKAASRALRETHLGAAQQARQRATEAARTAAEVVHRISQNEKLQENTLSRLRSADRAGQLAAAPEPERLYREDARPARQLDYVPLRAPAAEKLRVLYVTTHLHLDLSTELEVRQVQQALQGEKYRERVEVQLRPAATFPDLIAGLNSVRPHIVHFSGQSLAGLRLDGDLTSLMRALAVTDRPPELLVLNACGSLQGAATVLPAVPVIISMSESIHDTAAIVFSQQFYAAIASGQSVGAAFRHGKDKIAAVLLDDDASELPDFVARDDVNLDTLVLVQAH